MGQILILSSNQDAHIPFVQRHILGDCIIIDPQENIHGKPLSFTYTSAGIDIRIEDTKGTFWFIENNAGGQWAYIEQATSLPIGREIDELLMGSKCIK